VAALAFALNGGMATATSGNGPAAFHRVTVQTGQSLWQLAEALAPAADPRDVVSDIVHLNQLTGADVRAGQQLAVPQQYAR
jgi:LysM repeat protein